MMSDYSRASTMNEKRVFISFDFDHDSNLKGSFINQAKTRVPHLNIQDWSLPGPVDEGWKRQARKRIRQAEFAVIICGINTHSAEGVEAELTIIQQEGIPYILLKGHPRESCSKPPNARNRDSPQKWRWKSLNNLIVEMGRDERRTR